MNEVRLESMSSEEYADYRERSTASFAKEIAASRGVPLAEARRIADEDHSSLLPEGRRTPGHFLWTAWQGDQPVGDLWIQVEAKPDGLHAFAYGLEVRTDLRRRGYGRAIAFAAEQRCREMRVISVGLTVFGPNKAAQALYESLGFETTVMQMRLRLTPRPG